MVDIYRYIHLMEVQEIQPNGDKDPYSGVTDSVRGAFRGLKELVDKPLQVQEEYLRLPLDTKLRKELVSLLATADNPEDFFASLITKAEDNGWLLPEEGSQNQVALGKIMTMLVRGVSQQVHLGMRPEISNSRINFVNKVKKILDDLARNKFTKQLKETEDSYTDYFQQQLVEEVGAQITTEGRVQVLIDRFSRWVNFANGLANGEERAKTIATAAYDRAYYNTRANDEATRLRFGGQGQMAALERSTSAHQRVLDALLGGDWRNPKVSRNFSDMHAHEAARVLNDDALTSTRLSLAEIAGKQY